MKWRWGSSNISAWPKVGNVSKKKKKKSQWKALKEICFKGKCFKQWNKWDPQFSSHLGTEGISSCFYSQRHWVVLLEKLMNILSRLQAKLVFLCSATNQQRPTKRISDWIPWLQVRWITATITQATTPVWKTKNTQKTRRPNHGDKQPRQMKPLTAWGLCGWRSWEAHSGGLWSYLGCKTWQTEETNCRIIESPRLEKTYKIIQSTCSPITNSSH